MELVIIRIYTAKSRLSIPKAISSCMFLILMKSVTWFSHDCCGLPLLLLSCGVSWYVFPGQRLSSILRRCPCHFNCLLLIVSKIDCSACTLLLMVVFGIFCNLDTLGDLKYSISRANSFLYPSVLKRMHDQRPWWPYRWNENWKFYLPGFDSRSMHLQKRKKIKIHILDGLRNKRIYWELKEATKFRKRWKRKFITWI